MQIVHQSALLFPVPLLLRMHCKCILGSFWMLNSPLMYGDLRLQLKCKLVTLHTWSDRSSNRLGQASAADPILLLDIKSCFRAPSLGY